MGSISPVSFSVGSWQLIAAAGKEGVIFLLDAKSLGGDDHRTPLYRSPAFTNENANLASNGFWGAMTTWEENGDRWLIAPGYGPQHSKAPAFQATNGDTPDGSMMAFHVAERSGKPELVPMWRSPNMVAPDPAIYANGIVFVLASGDGTNQINSKGEILNSKQRAGMAVPAIFYALDARNGKPLYSSGSELKSFAHFSGLSISEGRIFAVTWDGKLHCFALAD